MQDLTVDRRPLPTVPLTVRARGLSSNGVEVCLGDVPLHLTSLVVDMVATREIRVSGTLAQELDLELSDVPGCLRYPVGDRTYLLVDPERYDVTPRPDAD